MLHLTATTAQQLSPARVSPMPVIKRTSPPSTASYIIIYDNYSYTVLVSNKAS